MQKSKRQRESFQSLALADIQRFRSEQEAKHRQDNLVTGEDSSSQVSLPTRDSTADVQLGSKQHSSAAEDHPAVSSLTAPRQVQVEPDTALLTTSADTIKTVAASQLQRDDAAEHLVVRQSAAHVEQEGDIIVGQCGNDATTPKTAVQPLQPTGGECAQQGSDVGSGMQLQAHLVPEPKVSLVVEAAAEVVQQTSLGANVSAQKQTCGNSSAAEGNIFGSLLGNPHMHHSRAGLIAAHRPVIPDVDQEVQKKKTDEAQHDSAQVKVSTTGPVWCASMQVALLCVVLFSILCSSLPNNLNTVLLYSCHACQHYHHQASLPCQLSQQEIQWCVTLVGVSAVQIAITVIMIIILVIINI